MSWIGRQWAQFTGMSPGILDRQSGGWGITLAGSLSWRNTGLVLGRLSLKREIMGTAADTR